MQPGVGTVPLPSNLQPGSPMLPYPGTIPNGAAQQQEFAAASSPGSLAAVPGTSSHANIAFWQGAPVQTNTRPLNPALAQSPIEQMGYTPGGAAGAVSASQAAAQLGMSAGPGSLFPVVPSDSASAGGRNPRPPVTPAYYEQRLNGEFPQSQQYQAPNNQYVPTNMPNPGAIRAPSQDGSASNQSTPNWPGASSARSNGTAQQGSAGNDVMITPSSPASNMSGPWDTTSIWQQPTSNTGSGVVQAGGSSGWNQSSPSTGDPFNAYQSDKSGGGAVSRYAKTPWDDPTSQPGGPRPYNGAWPNSNSLPNAAASGSGSSPNSMPIWNGGSGAGAPVQGGAASAPGSSSNSSPQQWPYSPQR